MHGACRQFFDVGEVCNKEEGEEEEEGEKAGGAKEWTLARPVGWRDPVNRAGVVQVSRAWGGTAGLRYCVWWGGGRGRGQVGVFLTRDGTLYQLSMQVCNYVPRWQVGVLQAFSLSLKPGESVYVALRLLPWKERVKTG